MADFYTGDALAEGQALDFRRVLFTTARSQLTLMALKPGEDIGVETHFDGDQIFLVLSGTGVASLNGVNVPVRVNSLVAVPAGTEHDIRNTGRGLLRLMTVFAPPQHRPGTVHHTKAAAARE